MTAMEPVLLFNGKVSSRSSKGKGGSPGETEVLRLNPQRIELIIKNTGWVALEPGSLNLEVSESTVNNLNKVYAIFYEHYEDILYPERYKDIPRKRGGYYYFGGYLVMSGIREAILIRRGKNPIPKRVEAFAPIHLRSKYGINDDQELSIEIYSAEDWAKGI